MRGLLTFLILGLAGCARMDPIPDRPFDPSRDSGSADFDVLLALGDGWMAGSQDNGLVEARQALALPARVADRLGKSVITAGDSVARVNDFVLPGYSEQGTPGTLWLVGLFPPVIEPVPSPGHPVNTGYQGIYNDLGIPGATLADLLVTVTAPQNPAFDLVLRGQGSAIFLAQTLGPSFVLLWAGTGDVLQAVLDDVPPTSRADFEDAYDFIVRTLANPPGNADIVAANIVDVLSLPFASTVPPVVTDSTGTPVIVGGRTIPLVGPDGLLEAEDKVTLAALPLLRQGIGIPAPIGTGDPLPDGVVLNATEQDAIRQAIRDYNEVIAAIAEARGFPVVDAHGWLEQAATGIPVGGVDYTSEFITGGLIGLDGIHPTDVGQVLLANRFIEAINAWYGSSIPLARVLRAAP